MRTGLQSSTMHSDRYWNVSVNSRKIMLLSRNSETILPDVRTNGMYLFCKPGSISERRVERRQDRRRT